MSNTTFAPQNLWDRLTRPHPAVTDRFEQQRARTLAGLSLALLAVTIPGVIAGLAFTSRAIMGAPHVAPLLAAYVFSRTRRPNWGSAALVFGSTGIGMIEIAIIADPVATSASAVFFLIPLLLSMILLRARATMALGAFIVLSLALILAFAPWVNREQMFPAFSLALVLSLIAIGTAFVRERDMALIQRQVTDLRDVGQSRDREAQNLQAIAEVGRTITATHDLDQLLKQVVNMIVERFDFYHAQVFLLDDAGKNAVLKASTGSVGQELLARGHHLAVGSRSVIGQVTARGDAMVVYDTDIDPIHRRNELLPQTRSEMALPLWVGSRVIGALDIQSVTPNAFSERDTTVFQAMADELATAIENARLFERAQRDLQDIETLNRQLTGEAWRKFLVGRSHQAPLGFESSSEGVRSISPDDQVAGAHPADGSFSLPLKIRGETIGQIDMTPRSGKEPDEATKAMLAAVAERVATALDSTRLGEQAQRQAEREEILSHLSAELQATTDLNTILRVVARETSRVLGTPTGFIHLTMEYSVEAESGKKDGADG